MKKGEPADQGGNSLGKDVAVLGCARTWPVRERDAGQCGQSVRCKVGSAGEVAGPERWAEPVPAGPIRPH